MSFGASFPTISISTTGTSKSLALPISASHCRVVNTSTTLSVYVQFGIDAATAVIPTADNAAQGSMCYVLPPNWADVFDVPKGANYIASIASGAGPTLVYFTLGMDE